MAISGTPVQEASDTTSSPDADIVIDATPGWSSPTSGNILLLCISVRENGTQDISVTITGSSGWTLVQDFMGTENGAAKGAVYWKVSAGNETTTTVTCANAPAAMAVQMVELDSTDLDTSALETSGENQADVSNGTAGFSAAVGSGNLSNTSADSLCVAVLAVKQENRWSATGPTPDNSYSVVADTLTEGAGSQSLVAVATKVTSATGSQECDWTTTDTGGEAYAASLIFAAAATATHPQELYDRARRLRSLKAA